MIIIKTPQPDIEERLVVVPPESCTPVFDDGKPAGLSIRAGARYATPEDLARAGFRECLVAAELEQTARRADDWQRKAESLLARAERAERERDDARRDSAEQARHKHDSHVALDKVVREARTLRAELARLTAPVEGEPSGADLRAIVDREGLRIGVDAALVALWRAGVAHERARLAAAGVTVATADEAALFEVEAAQDRATDEELERAYSAAYARAWESEVSTPDRGERAGLLAVAARVRQERCLVAQAVAANVDIRVCEDDGGGFMVGVHAPGCDEELARCVPASEVPATLARLLGEVARG